MDRNEEIVGSRRSFVMSIVWPTSVRMPSPKPFGGTNARADRWEMMTSSRSWSGRRADRYGPRNLARNDRRTLQQNRYGVPGIHVSPEFTEFMPRNSGRNTGRYQDGVSSRQLRQHEYDRFAVCVCCQSSWIGGRTSGHQVLSQEIARALQTSCPPLSSKQYPSRGELTACMKQNI